MVEKKEGAMKTIATIVVRLAMILGLLAAGFALGFPLGQQRGFDNGSEWAIVQADIAAREAGVALPFSLEEGQIHVIVRQPQDLHKRAQQQAELYAERASISQTRHTAVPLGMEAPE
jgi:hypothetical protein